jgi:hypothetical protein
MTLKTSLDVGTLCRSREPIVKTLAGDDARLCRVIAPVPNQRWRNPDVAEFKVELLAMPITAFLRENDLSPV